MARSLEDKNWAVSGRLRGLRQYAEISNGGCEHSSIRRFLNNSVKWQKWTFGPYIWPVVKYVFLCSYSSFPEYQKCEIIALPAKYQFKPLAFGFQKNSPYLPIFNFFMRQMKENGVMDKILEQYKIAKQVCPDYSG